ncbi:hypothetical protein E4T56_gene11335 [Termitomyces sp. T112]|nr:hypothetical protein E4T56_gene11335 [Termitomyces sp. T112]
MLQVFCCPGSVGSFLDWAAFEKDFYVEFFLLDPAKTASLTLHDREQYGQGKCMLDEYIDSFWALVEQAAYPNGLQLCLKFWDGLHPTLMEHIDSLVEGLLDDKRIASWYKVAWDQWQLMEIQRELHYPHSALCLALATSFHYLIPAHPMPAATLAIPASCLLPPGPLLFANLNLLNPPPLAFPHRKALYKDNWSSGGALEEEHKEEFGGIHKLELLDKAVEVGDQIYATTIHSLLSIAELWASQTTS